MQLTDRRPGAQPIAPDRTPTIPTRRERHPAMACTSEAPLPAVHYFDDTEDAYNATQCDDSIRDGDVLVIAREQVVGFLISAWPVAITEQNGELHTLDKPAHEYADGAWSASAALAEKTARDLGFPVAARHTAILVPDQDSQDGQDAETAPVEMPKLSKYGTGYTFDRHGHTYYVHRDDKNSPWTVTRHYGQNGESLGSDPNTRKAAVLQAVKLLNERQAAEAKPTAALDTGRETRPDHREPLSAKEAEERVSGTWPMAADFQPYHREGGHFAGYTFRVGHLHSARYGWITAASTYAKGLEPYRSTAADVLLHADRDDREATKPKPAGHGFKPGDRVKCPDGRTRTVKSIARNNWGQTQLHMTSGCAWTAAKCKRFDTSRVPEVLATLHHAGTRVRAEDTPANDRARDALTVIGDALRYLQRADPEATAAIREASTQRVTMEIPRTGIAPIDILHYHGVRLAVLETGVSEHQSTGRTFWWAEVLGVDEEDRRATYPCTWTITILVETAMWEMVTVERLVPAAPDGTDPCAGYSEDIRTVTAIQAGDLVEAVTVSSHPRTTRVKVDRQPWPGGPGRLVLSDGKGVDTVLTESVRIIKPAQGN